MFAFLYILQKVKPAKHFIMFFLKIPLKTLLLLNIVVK